MRCINHYGGYLCLPKSAVIYVSQEATAPEAVLPVAPNQPPIPAVPPTDPRLPQTPRTVRCSAGFTADEQNLCRGES